VTHADAITALRRLSHGLAPDLAGAQRLLERVAGQEEAEELRDALVELGVRALLDDGGRSCS